MIWNDTRHTKTECWIKADHVIKISGVDQIMSEVGAGCGIEMSTGQLYVVETLEDVLNSLKSIEALP